MLMGSRWFGLGWVILFAGLLSTSLAFAASSDATDEVEARSLPDQPDAESTSSGSQVKGEPEDPPMVIGRPGSIPSRLERDRLPKEYLFQFPGVSSALKPWYEFKNDLDKKYGFRFGISYTALYQKANDAFGPVGLNRSPSGSGWHGLSVSMH